MMDHETQGHETLGERLAQQGISRRAFLKFCTAMASLMALPPGTATAIAEALVKAKRPSVIWLSFQECTGCTESLTRSHSPTLESLIFDMISLDYHHTLQAASGYGAEKSREDAMKENYGKYLVVVDGSIPMGNPGYSTIAGRTNLDHLQEAAKGAAAIIAVGSCAAFGGIPNAKPNPTGAVAVSDIIKDKPIINISGCPPIPGGDHRRARALPHFRRVARTGRSGPSQVLLRRDHPRPLLSPPVLRSGQVCKNFRR